MSMRQDIERAVRDYDRQHRRLRAVAIAGHVLFLALNLAMAIWLVTDPAQPWLRYFGLLSAATAGANAASILWTITLR